MDPVAATPSDLLGRALAAFDGLAGVRGGCFRIGREGVEIRAAAAMAAQLFPPLEHLRVEATGAPDLVVAAWDEASTGLPLPAHPLDLAGPFRLRPRDFAALEVPYLPFPGGLSMLSRDGTRGLVFARDAAATPLDLRAAPLLFLLHWRRRRAGVRPLHAAAVGLPGRGAALLVGPSGAGKSGTALAAALGGLAFFGDDYVLVEAEPARRVFPLYRSAKVAGTHGRLLPGLAGLARGIAQPGDDKVVYLLEGPARAAPRGGEPLRVLLAPRVTDRSQPRLVPARPAEILRALAPTTLLQLPGGEGRDLADLAALARALPCYRLELGTDMGAVVAAVTEAITQPRPCPPG